MDYYDDCWGLEQMNTLEMKLDFLNAENWRSSCYIPIIRGKQPFSIVTSSKWRWGT